MAARQAGGLSLKARAIALLSRREHSRRELGRKLARYCDDPAEIQAVLDELSQGQWQSDQRYAEAYVRRQAGRRGAAWITRALREQGLADGILDEFTGALRATEAERALAVWQHRYGQPPADAREYARQYRFLAGRGFSPECVRAVLRGQGAADHSGD